MGWRLGGGGGLGFECKGIQGVRTSRGRFTLNISGFRGLWIADYSVVDVFDNQVHPSSALFFGGDL